MQSIKRLSKNYRWCSAFYFSTFIGNFAYVGYYNTKYILNESKSTPSMMAGLFAALFKSFMYGVFSLGGTYRILLAHNHAEYYKDDNRLRPVYEIGYVDSKIRAWIPFPKY